MVVRFVDMSREDNIHAFKYRVILSVPLSRKCGLHELANRLTMCNRMNLRFKLYIIYVYTVTSFK